MAISSYQAEILKNQVLLEPNNLFERLIIHTYHQEKLRRLAILKSVA